MKIGIPVDTATGMVNQHFGKSLFFDIVEVKDNQVINIETVSAANLQHNHGGLAKVLIEQGVSLALVGGIGNGAIQSLEANGIKAITGVQGSVKDAVKDYLAGNLQSKGVTCNCNHEHHHGH